jgi:hypothetical protein
VLRASLLLASLAACDPEPGGASQCLPIAGAVLRVDESYRVGAPRDDEEQQGTSLQGGPRPDDDGQGTSLQGGPRPDDELQGTSLQGGPRHEEEQQGTSLQGGRPRDDEEVQGTRLQGGPRPEEDAQGTSLQGGRPRDDEDLQGTQLQGPAQTQRGRRDEEEEQGTTSQGTRVALFALAGMRVELDDGTPVTLSDGRLAAGDLIGAQALRDHSLIGIASSGQRFALRLTTVTPHAGGELVALEADGVPVCNGDDAGMFVAGAWDDSGRHGVVGDELTYTCTDGVIYKCIDWGYAPWSLGTEVHQSCTRLARADYCGDGRPWTLDGTTIDVYDALGVQQRLGNPDFSFEAAWGEGGAVCVNATRYDVEDADGETILPDCFAELPRCESLAQATTLGAVLANDSAHTPIDACGA